MWPSRSFSIVLWQLDAQYPDAAQVLDAAL
jgi:hypothetical protein